MGKILAYAGVLEGYEATWIPSYGPEMRGGTANVTVILSNSKISSPISNEFDIAIILNRQSLDKFECRVKEGGTIIYDRSGVGIAPTRTDIDCYAIDAISATTELGNSKLYNMVVLGALLQLRPILSIESVIEALKLSLPERALKLLPDNRRAIEVGATLIQ